MQRRLEIRDNIERLEEQMCIYPLTREDARHAIEKLQEELERLELEYPRQTENLELD